MNILLIVPSRTYKGQPGYIDFPDEMLSVAGLLESLGHEVCLADCNVETLDVERVRELNPRIALFYVSTGPEIFDALEKSAEYNKLGIKIAWCGCHPSALPEQTLSTGCIDYVICGGAEIPLANLVADLDTGKPDLSSIPGLGYKNEPGKIRLNGVRTPLQDADQLPDPAWHLVDFKRYPDTNLNTSRGVRYASTFFPDTGGCLLTAGGEVPAKRLAAQMQRLRKEYGAKHVYFSGCGLAANGERLKEFCRSAIKDKLKIGWTLAVASNLDEKAVRLMKKAGCASVLLEVGSGSNSLRQFLEKGEINKVEETFWLLVKHKITPTVFVNYGYPSETEADFNETLDLLKRLDQPPTLFLKNVPYPGSKLMDYCLDKGLITKPKCVDDWVEFVQTCLSLNLSTIPQSRLNQALDYFRQTYASRRIRFMIRHNPGYFLSIIWKPQEFFKRIRDLIRYYYHSLRTGTELDEADKSN
jgi:anaerobic magnesium-protoporphyrin IX monomethyl ester cyclase